MQHRFVGSTSPDRGGPGATPLHRRAALSAVLAAWLLVAAGGALANTSAAPPGNTLRENNLTSCGGCHGGAGTANVIGVTVQGPAGVLPGQSGRYAITLSGITNAAARAGINAAVTKTGNANTQPVIVRVDGEPVGLNDGATQAITNTFFGSLRTPTNGSVTYLFDLAMPATASLGADYQLFAVGNAGHSGQARQVGWAHASTLAIKAAPPTPSTLTADQAAATTTAIGLSWSGTQGEHFRVIRKTGSAPTSPNDGTLVYEGDLGSATASGLAVGTTYFFAVYGKAPANNVYSAGAVQTVASTRPANPTALTAASGSSTEINLSWTGTSTEFRVLGKAGAFPSDANDATARVVYQGTAKNVVDSGLAAGTDYFYRVWGRTAGTTVYSTSFAQASASTAQNPVERHADAVSGNDQAGANPCTSAASPCRTITRAMAAAGGGDVLSIRPGVYSVAIGEVFPIAMKSGTQLVATGEPQETIIDGTGDTARNGLLRLENNTSNAARIEGLTLRNGLKVDQGALGGALYVASGSGTLTVTRCLFENNESRGTTANAEGNIPTQFAWGGAVFVFSHNVNINNSVFVGNRARGGDGFGAGTPGALAAGGAIYFAGTGSVANNSFVGNHSLGGNGIGGGSGGPASGGAITATGAPAPAIDNNIFFGNAVVAGAGPAADPSIGGAVETGEATTVRNNLFFGNTENGAIASSDSTGLGEASVLADPRFHLSPTQLRLRNSSPARAAARSASAPAIDFEDQARPTPPSIGAYEAGFVGQAIGFGSAPVLSVGGTAGLNATGGASGNAVIFSTLTPATCTVSGSTVSGVATGTCTVAANQAGNTDFTAAPQATQSFTVLAAPTFPLAVTRDGSGTGSVASTPAGIACGAVCTANFVQGSNVELVATPAAGSAFSGWSGSGCSGTGTCTVSISQARSVTATFTALSSFAVSLSGSQEVPPNAASGFGSGTVVIDPAANTLSYTFQVSGLSGALTGAHFHGPAARGANASVKIDIGASPFSGTVSYAQADEADLLGGLWYVNFHTGMFPGGELRGQLDNQGGLFAVMLGRDGTGSGNVSSFPAGIACGSSCSAAFAAGTMLTLTATPDPGSSFGGWSGACSGLANPCVLAVSEPRAVGATFTTTPLRTLMVTRSGAGSGTVSSQPAGIACGATCSASYTDGTVVTLTATAANGSTFSGWSGAGCTGTGTCVVTMNIARNVTASFATSGDRVFADGFE